MQGIFEKNDVKISVTKVNGFMEFEPMFHSHMEIVYLLSGSIEVCIDGISKKLEAGEVSITFPYSVHSYEKSDDAEAILMLFSPSSAEVFERLLLGKRPQYPYLKADEKIHNVLVRLEELSKYTDEISVKTLSSYLSAAVGEIVSRLNFIDDATADADIVQKVLMYCSEHFTEDISINSISKALYISHSSVTKVFSLKMKFPFRDYINILRISKAKKLLKGTNKKIIDIMYECGFKNQSSFNRVFYKQCQITPKEFRETEILESKGNV